MRGRMIRVGSAVAVALAVAACEAAPASPAPTSSVSAGAPSASIAPVAEPRSVAGRAVDAVIGLRSYRNLTLSRDGSRIAYSVAVEPLVAPGRRSVFVLDRREPSAVAQRVSAMPNANIDERSPDFSPDGKSVAILSAAQEGDLQLYLLDLVGGAAPRQLGHFDGTLAAARFSPDGRSIAVLHTDRAPAAAGPMVSGAKRPPQRIAVVDVATGESHFASPPDLHVYELDWSPDGRALAVTASPAAVHPNYYVAKLYVIAASGGAAPRLVVAPPRQMGDPRFSPDGTKIAFIGGLMSDEGNTGGDLFVVPAAGGAATNLTPGRKATITSTRWRADSGALFVNEIVDGRFAVSSIPAHGGAGEVLFQADATLRGLNVSADGETVAFLHDTFDAAQSIWSGPPRAPAQIAATRQPFSAPWGEVRRLSAPSDAYSIQSFLVAPTVVAPGRKYPLVVLVHGGPAASWVPAAFEYGALAAADYYLLLPNPRGSFGLGAAFQEANVEDFGHGDLRDIRASVAAALAAAPIDAERVGIAGWSYGGFMAMWAVTQSNEFRAAVAGAGVANWQSYYGQNDIPGWLPPYFGATVYDAPEIYAKSSPIAFVKQARTPTLLLVGERDTDCPPAQSREFSQALETLGVPTQLVVYPKEPHRFAQAENRRDRVERMMEWFDRHMPAR
jgi:dipeptidyl aminopeptidase/acylaminoacyl peptidase